jgi:hypothetical protein
VRLTHFARKLDQERSMLREFAHRGLDFGFLPGELDLELSGRLVGIKPRRAFAR